MTCLSNIVINGNAAQANFVSMEVLRMKEQSF